VNPRIARFSAWLIALALVATPIIAVMNGWLADQRWPIRRLVVRGSFEQVDEAVVRAAVAPHVRKGFFAVDLDAVRDAVEAVPWVERAEVRKHWPDRIDVRVDERVPIAFWGEERLLSDRGEVFAADVARVPDSLPRLYGPDTGAGEVWKQHRIARDRLAQIGLVVRTTRMNPRGAWLIATEDGGEILLGRERAMQRLDRFIAAMQRLPATESGRIARADLRYANGFSVIWRAPVVPEARVPEAAKAIQGSAHEPQV
jgi:cell division protein FtsQ